MIYTGLFEFFEGFAKILLSCLIINFEVVVVHRYSAQVASTLLMCGMETISRQKSLVQKLSGLRSVTRTSQEHLRSRNNNGMPLYFVVEHITLVGPFVCWIKKSLAWMDRQTLRIQNLAPSLTVLNPCILSLFSLTLLLHCHIPTPTA